MDMNMRLTGGDVAILSEGADDFAPENWLTDEEHIPEVMIEKKARTKLQTVGIQQAINILDERSQDIIRSRWLKDPDDQETLQDLAVKYGVSAERIRQIEVKAMEKMKKSLLEFDKDRN